MAAEAAVTFLLEKVTGVIMGYTSLISGAVQEFKDLRADLRKLKANLEKISNMSDDPTIKVIQDEVREAIYDAEDTIDSWLTEALARNSKNKGLFSGLKKRITPKYISLASQVKSLRAGGVKNMLDETANIIQRPGTDNTQQHLGAMNMDQSIRKDKVVRFGEAESTILGCLKTPQKELEIIPIIGMPGLGKTTMAWKIFNDESISSTFLCIWVQFSQRFDSEAVFVKIMNKINQGSNTTSNRNNDELSTTIRESLKGKKFLLVVDDVWDTKHWDVIKNALPSDNGSSKVLVTSRDSRVGRYVQHTKKPCELQRLEEDDAWELLQFEVFGNLTTCPKELKDTGKQIAHGNCYGVPLIILLMGGVLKDHYLRVNQSIGLVKDKWDDVVAKNVNESLESNDQVILDAVKMSYDSLPGHLRDCFLYLGVFPEGYKIPSWTLISLWIAEGLVKPRELESLEKSAEKNLNELINRNLLMASKTNSMHEAKECVVHDMIRVFCRSGALKENLFKEIKILEDQASNETVVSDMESIRRLCLHSNLSKFFSLNLEGPRVRSFLCFRNEVIDLELECSTVISTRYAKLRILQSKYMNFREFPESVIRLTHLRYIVLCVNDLKAIPKTISQLWNLQTIIVDTNSGSITMEANIWKMIQLRHVKTKSAIVLDDKWEGLAGKNIQILDRLSPESVTTAFSAKASTLKALGIRGKLDSVFDNMPLGKMDHLENLKLYHAVTENRLKSFPDRNRFPPNLKRLTLSNTSLDWKHMSKLALIDDLEVLKLKNNAFKGITWTMDNYVFKSLQFLHIVNSDLVLWGESQDSPKFLRLTHLVLNDCKKLKKIPACALKNLEHLEIEKDPKSLTDSQRKSSLPLPFRPE